MLLLALEPGKSIGSIVDVLREQVKPDPELESLVVSLHV